MVFSLFRRSDKRAARKGKGLLSDASDSSDSSAGNAADGAAEAGTRNTVTAEQAAREAARLTAQKIDEIENEIIADAITGIATNKAGSAAAPAADATPDTEPGPISAEQIDQVLSAPITPRPDPKDRAPILSGSAPDAVSAEQVDSLALATEPLTDTFADVASDAGTSTGRRLPDLDNELAIDIVDGSLPGALEEAAILYSNGQYQATAETLSACLEDKDLSQSHRTLSWQMLFDLLQVMGEREQFDSLAIRYARLTESSPPAWNDQMRAPNRRKVDRRTSPSNIIALREIDAGFAKFVDQLHRAADNKRECSIDFSGVRQMDADAAAEVQRLLNGFIKRQWPLSLTGIDAFFDLVVTHIEVGRADESQAFWQLSLLLLRVMGEQTRFDDLSIDYCVTFEVSPPPWEPLPGLFTMTDDLGEVDASATVEAGDKPTPIKIVNNKVILGEELAGKIQPEKAAMHKVAESNTTVRLDCRQLRRMDFAAAGELLNELAAMMGRSRKVQFLEPNFLVYALMLVMGIHEMAEIRRRKI